jgi:hypothetical protein
MSADPFVELRGEVLREHVDVLDAVAQATPGASRMSVLREIISEWVQHEKHRAMLVNRVTQGNGSAPEAARSRTGSVPAGGRR